MKPFLVESVGFILRTLNRLSPLEYLLLAAKGRTKQTIGALTELWVVSNFLVALLLLVVLPASPQTVLRWAVIGYSAIRILEIVSFQAFTQLYGGYRNKSPRLHYLLLSYRRSIFLAVLLYLEITAWFATLYRLNSTAFSVTGVSLTDSAKALYFSTITMTTVGYGDVHAECGPAFLLVTCQALIAVFMTLLIFARIVSYLPRPSTADPLEQETQNPD